MISGVRVPGTAPEVAATECVSMTLHSAVVDAKRAVREDPLLGLTVQGIRPTMGCSLTSVLHRSTTVFLLTRRISQKP